MPSLCNEADYENSAIESFENIGHNRSINRLWLCLFVILLGIYVLPVSGRAEGDVVLSSFEELKEACSDTPEIPASFLCTSDDLVFFEDLEIPEGTVFTFRHFTVPEGITLSVSEQAEIRTYGFTVHGTLFNRGKIVQQDLSASWADDEVIVYALISGHAENKGEMILTDVFGTRNINRFGGKLTMQETGSYADKRRFIFGDKELTPATEPVHSPIPTPASPENSPVNEIFDFLEKTVPRLAFFLVVVCFFIAVKAGVTSSRKGKQRKRSAAFTDSATGKATVTNKTSDMSYAFSEEDHFQRDKRNRMNQLDDWLKIGLIDRKEYHQLKRRYQEDR